jgi:hypothetical protein
MSRAGTQDVVTVKPANNVYTVLVIVTLLIVCAAMWALWKRADFLFALPGQGGGLTS